MGDYIVVLEKLPVHMYFCTNTNDVKIIVHAHHHQHVIAVITVNIIIIINSQQSHLIIGQSLLYRNILYDYNWPIL